MTLRSIGAALLLSVVPVAGCGTVTNLVIAPPAAGGKTPFGGVRQDVACIRKATDADATSAAHSQVLPALAGAADLPLSLVGDVVTWPYTASYTYINQPVPAPPITPAPTPPVAHGSAESPSPAPAPDTLPEPRKLP